MPTRPTPSAEFRPDTNFGRAKQETQRPSAPPTEVLKPPLKKPDETTPEIQPQHENNFGANNEVEKKPLALPQEGGTGNVVASPEPQTVLKPLPPPIEIPAPPEPRSVERVERDPTPAERGETNTPRERRNPAKLSDALWLQNKLRQLGFYRGVEHGWGRHSREALQAFKAANGLGLDDRWDDAVEERLAGTSQVRAEQSFLGGWATSIDQCMPPSAAIQPLRISGRRAQSEGGACEFMDVRRDDTGWNVRAVCTVGTDRFQSNIRFVVKGNELIWAGAKGTETYVRCR